MCSLTKDAVRLEAGIKGPECIGMHMWQEHLRVLQIEMSR